MDASRGEWGKARSDTTHDFPMTSKVEMTPEKVIPAAKFSKSLYLPSFPKVTYEHLLRNWRQTFGIQDTGNRKNRFHDAEMTGISRARHHKNLAYSIFQSGRMGVCLLCVMNNNISAVRINRCRLFIELNHITFSKQVPGNSSVIL